MMLIDERPRADDEKRSAIKALDIGLQTLSPAEIIILNTTSCQYELLSPINKHADTVKNEIFVKIEMLNLMRMLLFPDQ